MTQNDKMLEDLPRIAPSQGFEDLLLGDALAYMPTSQDEMMPEKAKKSVPVWAGFAMAASLAMGLWLGFGDMAIMDNAMSGLGIVEATEYTSLDVYSETFSELNS